MNEEIKRLLSIVKIEEPIINITPTGEKQGRLVIEPLIRGYGNTLGNSLRRVMLSSLPGSAVVAMSVIANGERVLHEFTAIPGVKEDVTEIILNIKGIVARLFSDTPVTAYIDVENGGVITAGDIKCGSELVILNPDHVIATLAKDANFHMELIFASGVGYVPSGKNKELFGDGTLGNIYVDSIYTPVEKVNYSVENARVGSRIDFEKLIVDITTNGSVSVEEAVIISAQIMKEHYGLISSIGGAIEGSSIIIPGDETATAELTEKSIDEMEFSVRSYNCLKRVNINTIGDITNMTADDVKKIRNLGQKSFDEIKEKLDELGLTFKED